MTASSGQQQRTQPAQLTPWRAVWRYALVGILLGFAFPVLATGIRLTQAGGGFGLPAIGAVQGSDPLLWIIDTAPLFLGLLAMFAGLRQDAAAARNVELAAREQELRSIQATLENRVAERTQAIEQRSRELGDAILLARQLSRISDTQALLTAAAKDLARTYAGYRADFYLLDEQAGTGALVASSSPAATAEHQSFRVGDDSIEGRAAAQGRSAVADEAHPDRARLALPLIVRGRTLGILSIGAESSEVVHRQPRSEILQLLADQIAAIVDSDQLLEQTRAALDQLQTLAGQSTGRTWRDFAIEHHLAYEYTPGSISRVPEAHPGTGPEWIQVPLTVRGQQVGNLAMRRDPSIPWTHAERDLARQVAAQAGSALENARLLVEAQERASRQQRMAELSSRLSATVDVDTLLQTAAQEIAGLPGVAEATVILAPATRAEAAGED